MAKSQVCGFQLSMMSLNLWTVTSSAAQDRKEYQPAKWKTNSKFWITWSLRMKMRHNRRSALTCMACTCKVLSGIKSPKCWSSPSHQTCSNSSQHSWWALCRRTWLRKKANNLKLTPNGMKTTSQTTPNSVEKNKNCSISWEYSRKPGSQREFHKGISSKRWPKAL